MKKIFSLFAATIVAMSLMASEEVYSVDFTQGQSGWTINDVTSGGMSTSVWQQTSSYGMMATAYVDGTRYATESWLISPQWINLSQYSSATLTFSQARRYGQASQLSVRAQKNGSWTTLSVAPLPDGSNWNFVTSEADLSAFVGENPIKIAFVYTSTTSQAATWEIKTVTVTGEKIKKKCGDNLTWDLTNGVLTISGSGAMYNFPDADEIPWWSNHESISQVVIGNGVTSIGQKAFYRCSGVTSVTIGNSVTSIGEGAFYDCWGLTSVTIPNSVTSIGKEAFAECGDLTSVTIPNSVTSIGEGAFSYCHSLTSVTIPNSVTSIGDMAFYWCWDLTSVTIPNSVTSIGSSAFNGCHSLTSVTIPNSVTSIGEGAFNGCSGLTSVTIPNSVTSIGKEAFAECYGLTSVTIPNGVTSIGQKAFYGCNGLTSVTIGNSVTSIGDQAFQDCYGLTSVTIEAETPPTIGNRVFTNYDYCPIYVPCGTLDAYKTAWSAYAYLIEYVPYSYAITPKAINGYITTTSTNFTMCDAEHPVICTANPDRGCYFVRWADGNTENPRTIELSQDTTMEAIFDYLLEGKCGKDSALTWTFEAASMALNITGKGALSENYTYGTFIESLTIGNEITSIGEWAFGECNNLKTVIIGSSVKVLEESAFGNCSAIESITCYGQRPPTVNQNALYGLDYSTIIYVPADYLETYKMHDAWGLYDVRPLGAKSTETTDVNVTPAETTAEVAWPAISGAATYELVIKDKSGNVICTLIFNANGQLTSIAFAPSRNNAPQQTQATGFSFTVTGLENGTSYDLTITSKDNNGGTLDTKTVSFTTTGEEQGVDEVQSDKVQSAKVVRNGQIFILRGEKIYTLQGQEVK